MTVPVGVGVSFAGVDRCWADGCPYGAPQSDVGLCRHCYRLLVPGGERFGLIADAFDAWADVCSGPRVPAPMSRAWPYVGGFWW